MADEGLFSVGVDQLLQRIRPYADVSIFPTGFDEPAARRQPAESLRNWFVRMVDHFCGGDTERAAIENNIAVFVRLGWRDRKTLVYANIQALVTDVGLEDFYLGDESAGAQYLRLDLDYQTLGDPFSHPLAHVHVEGDLSPRFALDGGDAGNIVVDFLEFLYRNYAPAKWLAWVEREWTREYKGQTRTKQTDALKGIVKAFGDGQFQTLRDLASTISKIKKVLRKRKDEAFRWHMAGSDRDILKYP